MGAPHADPAASRIAEAEAAFAAGDYARLRASLAELEGDAEPEVRARAAQLARAISPDPAFVAVVALGALGWLAAFMHYVLG